ncbi:hypothetical protein RDI58_024110 [Solanum bulbocastanum]|uniref:Uncharacterized protein n=1 Tax=Solanum bulbocastanum TaxID=147425 RepID=A0AAN8SWY7_SOLBU
MRRQQKRFNAISLNELSQCFLFTLTFHASYPIVPATFRQQLLTFLLTQIVSNAVEQYLKYITILLFWCLHKLQHQDQMRSTMTSCVTIQAYNKRERIKLDSTIQAGQDLID